MRQLTRFMALAVLPLGLAAWLVVGGPLQAAAQAPAPPVASQLIATQEMSSLPFGRHWVIRSDHQLNAEHSHTGGFVYVVKGSTVLQLEGSQFTLTEGQGMWVPEGVPHTHRADPGTQLWTFSLETQDEAKATPSVYVSEELSTAVPGPHLARLLVDTYAVGTATPPHRHFGPEVVYVRQGSYELNYSGARQSYVPGNAYTVLPPSPHQLRNAGQDAAQLFGISLVPLGKATSEALPPDTLR